MKIQTAFLVVIMSAVNVFAVRADNSKINQRDQQSYEYTADQQGRSKEDTQITREIRRALVREKSLSTYAKNVKIITVGGEVTLKGPVKSVAEQNLILQKAQAVVGVTHVYNQTDIVTKK